MARDNLRATEIMTEKLERIRLYRWSQVNQPGLIATNFSVAYDSFSTNPIYSGTIAIAPASFSSNYTNQMRLVTVELTWTTGNVQRSRRMSTYVTFNGLHTYVF